jgi:hypothetical protein
MTNNSLSIHDVTGLDFARQLVQPDEQAWHLKITCAQLQTCHILPLNYGLGDIRQAIAIHVWTKVQAAERC